MKKIILLLVMLYSTLLVAQPTVEFQTSSRKAANDILMQQFKDAGGAQIPSGPLIDQCSTFTLNGILFDHYYGLAATTASGGAQNHFYLEKDTIGSKQQWYYVDPCGHFYFPLMIADSSGGGHTQGNPPVYQRKYGSDYHRSAVERDHRMGLWNFTGVGSYAAAASSVYGLTNSYPGEIILFPSDDMNRNPTRLNVTQSPLNPVIGMPCSTYNSNITRGEDYFSTWWTQGMAGEWAYQNQFAAGGSFTSASASPWLIHINIDDADYYQWIRALVHRQYPNAGWIIAVDAFNYNTTTTGCGGGTVSITGHGVVNPSTYVSGGTISGSAGQTCKVQTFCYIDSHGNNICLANQTIATVPLDATNHIASGTPLTIQFSGSGSAYPTAPTTASLANGSASCTGTATVNTTLGWLDGRLYSKYAEGPGISGYDFGLGWGVGQGYLSHKYASIQALNAAWGTTASGSCNDGAGGFYTSFDDAGGYGVGCGLLDEDGRHTAWMGNDPITLDCVPTFGGCIPAHAQVKIDLDAFQYFVGLEAFKMVGAIRAPGTYQDTYHIILPPDAMGGNSSSALRPEIAAAIRDAGTQWGGGHPGFGAVKMVYHSSPESCQGPSCINSTTTSNPYDIGAIQQVNNVTGLPIVMWYSLSSNPDSYDTNCGGYYGAPQFRTQTLRQQQYGVDLPNWQSLLSTDSTTHYIAGMMWWSYTDSNGNPSGGYGQCNGVPNSGCSPSGDCGSCTGEASNEGIVSNCDNGYYQNWATKAGGGLDPWGLVTGGEAGDYGDSMTGFTAVNYSILNNIISGGGSTSVSDPIMLPSGGTYNDVQNVAISTATLGATICYTTDGSTPTTNGAGSCVHGATYTTPVPVTITATVIKAIGTKSGLTDSNVVTNTYTLSVSNPSFFPHGGTYSSSQTVSITSSPGATIWYNTSGSPSCGTGTMYIGPVIVSVSETLYAIGCRTNFNPSSVTSATYVITGGGGGPQAASYSKAAIIP